jgi:hypothetical protein
MDSQPILQLQDVNNAAVAVAGVTVTAGILHGTSTITSGSAISDASGVATFSGLALTGTTDLSDTLTFTSGVLTAVTATKGTKLGVKLGVTQQPSLFAASGVNLGTPPFVQVQDFAGTSVDSVSLTITAGVVTGPGLVITNGSANTNSGGFALFGGLTLTAPSSGALANYTLTFTAPGLTSATAAAPTALATKMGVFTQPSILAASGTALATQPVVQLQDVNSALVAVPGAVSILALTTQSGANLTNNSVNTSGGVATFSGLTLTAGATPFATYQLQFTANTLPTVNAAATTQFGSVLTVATQPSPNGTSGVALAQQPAIQLRDAITNTVALAGISITALVTTGTGTVTAGATATTDPSGLATFIGLAITGTGSNTLSFRLTNDPAIVVAGNATLLP